MYALSAELAPRIAALGLGRNLEELQAHGYTVVSVGRQLTDRLRPAILRVTDATPEPNSSFDKACGMPLGQDPVISEACEHPAITAIAEYICGRGFLLSAVLATVRSAGSAIPLHCDQSWLPAPFPEHFAFMTACWITDDFTRENGATCIVPHTHELRRPPKPEEMSDRLVDAVPIEAPAGSVAIWDGALWHGNFPRTTDGERAVLHVSYGRLGYQIFHDFSYLSNDFRQAASAEMRAMLGGNLGFRTNSQYQHFDAARFGRMSADVRR